MDGVNLSPEGEQRRVDQARAWLSSVRKLSGYVAALEASVKAQLDAADNLRGLDYSAVRVTKSPSPDAIPNAVIAHMEAAEALEAIAGDAKDRLADAAQRVSRLEDPFEAACLTWYYIRGVDTWERVCVKMGCGYEWIMKTARRALLHMYEYMPPAERDRIPHARPRSMD